MNFAFLLLIAFAALVAVSIADRLPLTPRWNDDACEWSLVATVSSTMRRGRGRPRKFTAPSRAVTLNLPESVLAALSHAHDDISKAIGHLMQRRSKPEAQPLAELSIFDRSAVITVRPTPSLEQRGGIRLVLLPGIVLASNGGKGRTLR